MVCQADLYVRDGINWEIVQSPETTAEDRLEAAEKQYQTIILKEVIEGGFFDYL